jgi:hypothetical protein
MTTNGILRRPDATAVDFMETSVYEQSEHSQEEAAQTTTFENSKFTSSQQSRSSSSEETSETNTTYAHVSLKQRISGLYKKVTSSWLWRRTGGTLSCAFRIPYYIFAVALQAIKVIAKVPFIPLFNGIQTASDVLELRSRKFDNFTSDGVTRDAIMLYELVNRTINSLVCTIFAPPKNYRSIVEAGIGARDILVGKYHTQPKSDSRDEEGQMLKPPMEMLKPPMELWKEVHKASIFSQISDVFNNETPKFQRDFIPRGIIAG